MVIKLLIKIQLNMINKSDTLNITKYKMSIYSENAAFIQFLSEKSTSL